MNNIKKKQNCVKKRTVKDEKKDFNCSFQQKPSEKRGEKAVSKNF